MPEEPWPLRKMIQRSFRLFEDQYKALRRISTQKYHGLRNTSDLVRQALEEFIERENKK